MVTYTPQPKKKKRPAPAGPIQNIRMPRKSTGGGNPLNRPAPNPTGGVAGPSAPTRRSKPAGGYAKNKTKPAGYAKPAGGAKFKAAVLPPAGTRPGAKPVTAAQRAYAKLQTAKSAVRASGAKKKAAMDAQLKKLKNANPPKPGTGTRGPRKAPTAAQLRAERAAAKRTANVKVGSFPKVSKPKPGSQADKMMKGKSAYYKRLAEKAKAGKSVSSKKQPVLKGLPKLGKIKPTAKLSLREQAAKLKAKAPVLKGLPKLGNMKPGTGTARPEPKTAKRRPKTGGIAMSQAARKAMAFRKVEEAKKAARVKRTGESLATTAAQVRARKEAAGRTASARAVAEKAKRRTATRKRVAGYGLTPTQLKAKALKAAAKKRGTAGRPTGGPRRPGMGRNR